MKQIYKYQVIHGTVLMPKGAKILTAQIQDDTTVMWALVDTSQPMEPRNFEVMYTGQGFDDTGLEYIQTVQDGPLVLHIFERV
jgi:hypothetical protein